MGQVDRVLHDHDVHGLEIVGLQSVYPVDPGQQRLVLRVSEVLDVVVEDAEHEHPLRFLESLDEEAIVEGEEEERAALASTLASLEDHVPVGVQCERVHDVLRVNAVHLLDDSKLVFLVGGHDRLEV